VGELKGIPPDGPHGAVGAVAREAEGAYEIMHLVANTMLPGEGDAQLALVQHLARLAKEKGHGATIRPGDRARGVGLKREGSWSHPPRSAFPSPPRANIGRGDSPTICPFFSDANVFYRLNLALEF